MKISDITTEFNEDNSFGKIANIDPANKKVTIDKPDGSKMDVPTTAIMPDPTKPGQATIDPSATSSQLKPGEMVNTPTQETIEENPETAKHFDDWMHSEYCPYKDDAGDDNKVHMKAMQFLHSRKVPHDDIEMHAKHMAHKFHGSDLDEAHKDTIAQGGGDVGGDATDSFISQIKDKEFERKNRTPGGTSASPIGGKKLSEDDELSKWLTIAGIK